MSRSTFSGPITSNGGVQVGSSGTTLTQITKGTITVDPASLAADAVADTDVTLTGAATTDVIIVHPPGDLTADLEYVGSWISAANTVTIRLKNNSGGAIDEASAAWNFVLIKS